jgi:hypothetical protein
LPAFKKADLFVRPKPIFIAQKIEKNASILSILRPLYMLLKITTTHQPATEGAAHFDKNHIWHMTEIAQFCRFAPEFLL